MTYLRPVVIGLLAFGLMAGSASAQKKAPKKAPAKKPSAATQRILPPLEVRAAREKVDIQLSNVNRFVDIMGSVVQGIETLDASAKTRTLPQATVAKNELTKKKLVEAIRNLRAGLLGLESEFRAKPALQRYHSSIEGITDMAAASEDSALGGRFVEAKEPLREVSKKLAGTLAAMPL